ncbi:MAG: YybH family protein [Phycisphaerales bacterium]
MKQAILACLVLVVCGCAGVQRSKSGDADLRGTVVARNQELVDRFNRGDKIGVARMYADDAIMMSDRERHAGREAIDAYWAGPQGAPKPPRAIERWKLDVLSVEGSADLVVQRGRSTIEGEWEGKPRASIVEFVVIWRRQSSGDYRIAVDAWWRE